MKKSVVVSAAFILLVVMAFPVLNFGQQEPDSKSGVSFTEKAGINCAAIVDSKYFYLRDKGKWKKKFIKGVNIGAAKPGTFPGELAITRDEYLRWFKYIGDMNANSIRVYTLLKPEFYDALYEYNQKAKNKIYLFQGVWVNEEDVEKYANAFAGGIYETFNKDIKTIIDVIHGNCEVSERRGYAGGKYTKDVSNYVAGWILGIEWAPEFVEGTDKANPDKSSYKGKFLYTLPQASPFEVFLCGAGDFAIEYETSKYQMQRPLSFTNWVTTDVLKHPNEPFTREDSETVDVRNIKGTEEFGAGLFASYHVYPYYPDSMNYQKSYAAFKDKNGKVNTYRAYLKDLIKEYSMPVLVAEFGVPSSRGMAHTNIYSGFNQGNIDEKSQGEFDASMLKDIYEEGYAGGLVFSWQDEWFKRTWNTMDFDISDRRPLWSNPQSNEQEFGLLAFDPGKDASICYVDGDVSDWKLDLPITAEKGISLYAKADEKYLYFMADVENFNIDRDVLLIPLDTIRASGSSSFGKYGVDFKRKCDFVVAIDGKNNSRVLVNSYYDVFYYLYAKKLKMISTQPQYEVKNSGIFNPIYLCLSRELYLPEDKVTIPISTYETGKLQYGDGNPGNKDYNSLTDFAVKGNKIEVRIPWQLLNVMDPSTKMIMDDFYAKGGFRPLKVNEFYIGCTLVHDGAVKNSVGMKAFSWKEWEQPQYHERLKPSYFILKDAFKKYN